MGLNQSSNGFDRDFDEHLWWVSFACLISLLFFGGEGGAFETLGFVLYFFGVKMKENKRRFWVFLLFVNCLVS